MLSKKPSARGSTSQVDQALEHAVTSTGLEADQPIARRPRPTGVSRRPGLWLIVAAGLTPFLLLPGAWSVWRHQARLAEGPTETTGLAQDALPGSGSVQAPPGEITSSPMPKDLKSA
jgi:eukaryotic-like serine/threonine-protein kinase